MTDVPYSWIKKGGRAVLFVEGFYRLVTFASYAEPNDPNNPDDSLRLVAVEEYPGPWWCNEFKKLGTPESAEALARQIWESYDKKRCDFWQSLYKPGDSVRPPRHRKFEGLDDWEMQILEETAEEIIASWGLTEK